MTSAVILILLGMAYLALLLYTLLGKVELTAAPALQYALHFTVILTALFYFLFIESVCDQESWATGNRLLRMCTGLFVLPILIGRTIGLFFLAQGTGAPAESGFQFYAAVSVSWTILFPLSMFFLAAWFIRNRGLLARFITILCVLAAVCCLVAFVYNLVPDPVFMFTGVAGCGVLFLFILILFVPFEIKRLKRA